MKKILLLLALTYFLVNFTCAQSTEVYREKVFRLNLINPGIEYEYAFLSKSTVLFNIGVGYGGSYPNLTKGASGWLYVITPFIDIQYRYYYNLNRRIEKGKNINYNSGDFFGFRSLSRGEDFDSNFTRSSEYDFAFGPIWGLQRSFYKINFLFDIGVIYYLDTIGNCGIIPMLELSISYNLFSNICK